MTAKRALIIDDEPDIRELLEITLSRMNLATYSAGDIGSARQLLASRQFQLCLTDMRLPDGDGLQVLRHIAEQIDLHIRAEQALIIQHTQ